MFISRRRRNQTAASASSGTGNRLTSPSNYRITAPGNYRITEPQPAFSIPATATFTYDPLEPTHKMAWNWAPLKYLDPANTDPSWGDAPTWTPQDLGTVTASGASASSVVWSIDTTKRECRGISLVTTTPGQCTVRMWSDREFHNATLGSTRTITLTATVGALVQTCQVTLNADFTPYTGISEWTGVYAGITHKVGCTSDVSALTPFPAYGGSYPTGWTMVENTYTGFSAGTLSTTLKWYEIQPTGNNSSLSGYDCSGLAFRNPSNYTNISVTNCYFDGSVWGMSPMCLTSTTTVNPNGVGSKIAVVGSTSGITPGQILSGNSDYPSGTYVEALGVGFTGSGVGGSAVITGIADTSILTVGWTLAKNDCMAATRTIASIDSATQITLSGALANTQTYSNIYFYTSSGPAAGTITLSNAAVADSGAVSTTFVRGFTQELISFPSASTATVTFTDCTIDMKGETYPWFTNGIVTRHPNQSFIRCSCINAPNDNGNFNGGTYERFYATAMGSNNWSLNNNGIGWLPRGWEVSAGNYWGHCDNLQGFNVNQNFTITESYLDDRWYNYDPLKESLVAGGTAAMFMESNTTGSMLCEATILRGGTGAIYGSTSSTNAEALSTYRQCLIDGDSNIFQVRSPPRQQMQAYDNYYVVDWTARVDASTPGPGDGSVTYTKGTAYGPTLNPPIVAPATTVTVQGSDYIRFGFTPQADTKYEGRWRTTAGPGAWSSWEAFEDQTFLLYVPGGSASPDLSPSTAYDIEIRGYNDTCLGNPSGTRLISDGPAASLSITTAAAKSADADAAAILAAWTTAATVYERDAVYDLVASLKGGANAWAKIGHLACWAAGSTTALTEQRGSFNWKAPATTYTKVGSPTFRTGYGGGVSAGNNGGRYFQAGGWTPGFGGDTLALQDDCSFFRYMVATDGTPSNQSDLGNTRVVLATNNGSTMRFQLASSTSDGTANTAESPYLGLAVMTRSSSSTFSVRSADPGAALAHVDGSPYTRTSVAFENSPMVWLGQNSNTAGSYTIARSSRGYMAFQGGGLALDTTEETELKDALEAFLDWFDALPA